MCDSCDDNGVAEFDFPYTPSPEAIAVTNQTLDFIEENPQMWNQRDYGNPHSDTSCFFGMLIRISGVNPYELPNTGFGMYTGMNILGMHHDDHFDRASYISYWHSAYSAFAVNRPTVDELRDRVSVALNHDFRKTSETQSLSEDSIPSYSEGINGDDGQFM